MYFKVAFTAILVILFPVICCSQDTITEKMVINVADEKHDSIKINLYNRYFKILKDNDDKLIMKYKKQLLQLTPSSNNSESNYAELLCLMGVSYKGIEQYDSASKYCTTGLNIFSKLKNKRKISWAYNLLGNLEKDRNKYTKALQYYYASIEPLDKEKDKDRFAISYMNIGIVYRNLKNPGLAIKYYNSCDSLYKSVNDTDGIIKNNANKYNVLVELKRFDEARAIGLQTEELTKKFRVKKNIRAKLDEILAEIYSREENHAKAIEYQLKRLVTLQQAGNDFNLGTLYGNMATEYIKWGKKIEGNKYYDLAVKIFSSKPDFRNQITLLTVKIEYLRLNGNYKEALDLYEKKYKLNDSIFSSDLSEKVSKMENDISNQKREKDVELLEKNQAIKDLEIKRQRFVNYGLLVLVALIVAFAFFILKSLKANKRINSELNIKNKKVEEQSAVIEEKNKDIIDSINYAQRLQQILLPAEEEFKQALPQSFLFFEPKDIVSGDFYFIEKTNDFIFIAVVDCTGHGVPGAIMSMVANNLLNKIIKEKKLSSPSEILQELNTELYFSLKQNVSQQAAYDGMDISVCIFYPLKMQLHYAAANSPVYIVSDKKLVELKPDKAGLGKTSFELKQVFAQQTIDLKSGDMVYMFSDGYADQFGGVKAKKMMKKNMKKLLIDIYDLPANEQNKLIANNFKTWKGNLDQVDDVTILGFKV